MRWLRMGKVWAKAAQKEGWRSIWWIVWIWRCVDHAGWGAGV